MSEYEIKLKAIDDAAFELLKLSSAYGGELGTILYCIAADVGDRMRKARREVKSAVDSVRHDYLKPQS